MIADSIYYNVGNFIYLGVLWIISIALVRIGGFEDAGVFSLAITVSTIFNMIANYGLRSFQVSDVKNRFSDYTYIVSRIITCFVSLIICVVYLIMKGYELKIFASIFGMMLYKCIESYCDVIHGIWQKNGNMLDVGISYSIRGILNGISFFICYLLTHNILFSIIVLALSSLISMLTFDFYKTKKYVYQAKCFKLLPKGQLFPLLFSGILTMLFVFSTSVFNGIPRLLIEVKCGIDMLGVFSSVFTPTVVISTFAIGVLLPVAPKITENYNSRNTMGIIRLLLMCISILIGVGIVAEIVSALIGKQVFEIIFGSEILEYFNLFYAAIIVSVLISMVNCYSTVLISIRHLKQLLAFSVAACILVLLLSLALIHQYSIYGAAYAMIIALVIQFVGESVYIAIVLRKNAKTV